MLEWYWVCASSDKSRSGKTSALSMSLLYTSLLVLMMSYIYMTHTRTSLLIIALPISIALFHKQTHVHVGVYERHVLCVAWFVVMSCYKHSALHACQDWGDNSKKAWLVNYMHDNTFLPRLLCIFCTLQRIPEAIDSHETNSWWTLEDCTVELDWSNDIWSIAKMHVSIYKFIWRVWPWTSSVQILPVPLLALSVVKSHMYVPIPGFVPYAGWIFHQRRQQRLGPAERVSKTKPHRCVNKLRGSIMHHPLLFLTQHPSSQHNTEERESRFPWAVRRQRLTVCESVSVCV